MGRFIGGVVATSLKIDDALKGRVKHLASMRDRSAHWIMREAIREYVEREEARESFKAEALASWAEFQETGQHITGKELTGRSRLSRSAPNP